MVVSGKTADGGRVNTEIGVDLSAPSRVMLFALGTKIFGEDMNQWVYVRAKTTIKSWRLVVVNKSGVASLSPGNRKAPAITTMAFNKGDYGFVLQRQIEGW